MLITLIVLICLILLLYWWYSSNRRREAAFNAAEKYCHDMHVQLLDQSVQCHRIRPILQGGQFKLKTTYRFDYTVHSADRQHCHLILIGHDVQWIGAIKTGETAYTHASAKGDRVVHFSNYSHLKPKNDGNDSVTEHKKDD